MIGSCSARARGRAGPSSPRTQGEAFAGGKWEPEDAGMRSARRVTAGAGGGDRSSRSAYEAGQAGTGAGGGPLHALYEAGQGRAPSVGPQVPKLKGLPPHSGAKCSDPNPALLHPANLGPGLRRDPPALPVVEDLDDLLEGRAIDPVDERLVDQADGAKLDRVVTPLVVAARAIGDRRVELGLRHRQRLGE